MGFRETLFPMKLVARREQDEDALPKIGRGNGNFRETR